MIKVLEALLSGSCWNKARPDQYVFVLIDSDETMAETIRGWCARRIARSLNKPTDAKIMEALDLARRIETRASGVTQVVLVPLPGKDTPQGDYTGWAGRERIRVPEWPSFFGSFSSSWDANPNLASMERTFVLMREVSSSVCMVYLEQA